MSFANLTQFAAHDVPVVAPDGRDVVLVVVKGSFGLDGTRLARQEPVWVANVHSDPEAEDSSVLWPSDVALHKPMTDIVVVGAARARRPTRVVEVSLRMGDRREHLRVHGERLFYRGAGGRLTMGEAAPFEAKPLTYERAFGGKGERVVEQRNPVGRGVADGDDDLVDTPAPQIEWGDAPYDPLAGRVEPAGFGAIAPHWMPRAGYYGTLDARWETERMPLAPEDFDPRYDQCAHPRLQLASLPPGTLIGVDGMSVEGPLTVALPELPVAVSGIFDDTSRTTIRPAIDTVVLDTENRRVMVAGRAAFPLGRGKRPLRAVRVEDAS